MIFFRANNDPITSQTRSGNDVKVVPEGPDPRAPESSPRAPESGPRAPESGPGAPNLAKEPLNLAPEPENQAQRAHESGLDVS